MSSPQQAWHITEDEVEVPVRIAETKNMKPVSRKPAAIVGITIATIIGAMLTFDLEDMRGQVVEEKIIRITTTGLEPLVLAVSPGETITWVNEQEIPHYLLSDTLCENINENCMTTETAFSGQEIAYTIPSTVPNGAYTYFSPTDGTIVGTLSVGGSVVTSLQPAAPTVQGENTCYSPSDCVAPKQCSSLEDGIIPGTCRQKPVQVAQNTTTETPLPTTSVPVVDTVNNTSPTDENIPTNPLLESIQRQLELDRAANTSNATNTSQQNPVASNAVPGIPQNPYTTQSPSGHGVPNGLPASTTTTSTQMPFQQPATGSGTWLALFAGFLAFIYVKKRMNTYEVRQ